MDTRAALEQGLGACGSRSEPQSSGYAQLARRITTWTTNLLASAIVLAAGLAMGWQVLDWWHERPQPAPAAAPPTDTLLPLVESHDFWTSGGPLRIERVRGDRDAALAAMRNFCRQESGRRQPPDDVAQPAAQFHREADASRSPGSGEAQFVASLVQQTPLESAGDLDLYQPPGQAGMVVAVSRGSRRIVAWSLASQRDAGEWSLFHFRPAAQNPGSAP